MAQREMESASEKKKMWLQLHSADCHYVFVAILILNFFPHSRKQSADKIKWDLADCKAIPVAFKVDSIFLTLRTHCGDCAQQKATKKKGSKANE